MAANVAAGADYSTESGFTTAFLLGCAAVALALLAATLIPSRRAPQPALAAAR